MSQARLFCHRTCQQFILLFETNKNEFDVIKNKTEANLASADALAARCVRVIHAQCVLQFALLSRTLLRSSSNNEPSDPPYRIIFFFHFCFITFSMINNNDLLNEKVYRLLIITSLYVHNGATQSLFHSNETDDCARFDYHRRQYGRVKR